MKTEPVFSKNYEKTHLSSIKTFEHRRAFFCQLDNERHPLTESGYECERCSRTICDQCYQTIVDVGVAQCPYCRGKLGKFQ
jgi:hypothetical protein